MPALHRITFPLLIFLGGVCLAPAAPAKDIAEHASVNQTMHLTLEGGETKDYELTLARGSYWLVWDDKRVDEKSSNIQAEGQLLKTNGVIVDSGLAHVNEVGLASRIGVPFHVPRTFVARLRVRNTMAGNEDAQEMWLTVLPAASLHFLSFSFGASVDPAKVGTVEGVGGTLEKAGEAHYYRATLPPGRWSISLGLKASKSGNLGGSVDLLDANGFVKTQNYVNVNEIGTEARKETIMILVKPKTVLLRIVGAFDYSTPIGYDLTITKATD